MISSLRGIACLVGTFALTLISADLLPAAEGEQRIVFMGDSITDGHTYPLLFADALKQAGLPVPVCINAGIAGDTARGMRARLDRDVLVHKPTLVTLSAGINDVLRGVSTDDYAEDMRAIAARLKELQIPLVILTPTLLGKKHADAEQKLAEYIAVLREIAKTENCRIAEIHAQMQAAASEEVPLLEADDVHLTLAGYWVFTRALLDALGHAQVPVPEELRVALMPGVITDWELKPLKEEMPALDEMGLKAMLAEPNWVKLTLPLEGEEDHWWMDQERRRGFAVSLGRRHRPAKKFLARAKITRETPLEGYVNVGAAVDRVWLNGKLIYKSQEWTGWHAGKERISVTFDQGENILVLESGDTYFLSITSDNQW